MTQDPKAEMDPVPELGYFLSSAWAVWVFSGGISLGLRSVASDQQRVIMAYSMHSLVRKRDRSRPCQE